MKISSKRILTENGFVNGILEINQGTIQTIRAKLPQEEVDVDYGQARIIPGIFDTHNHGTHGYNLMLDEDLEAQKISVRHYLKALASQGVTGIFPTASIGMIRAVAEVAKENLQGAKILGIHSEGPWLNRVGEKGIKTGWPEVSLDIAKKMVEDGQGLLKLVALAPEIPGIDEVIDYFLSQGVVLANAHSDNNFVQSMEAYDKKGLRVSTHTGNVMTGLHHRDIGGLGAALSNDKVECEVICDGMHVCLDMLKIYFKQKDPSRFMMISDCSGMAGAPVGEYTGLFSGNMVLHMTPDGFVLSDTGRLCGSSQPVLFGVGNLVEKNHMPIEIVSQMASKNPSHYYGYNNKGTLKVGSDADFAVITDDYQAIATYVEGQKVFDQQVDQNLFNPDFLAKYAKR